MSTCNATTKLSCRNKTRRSCRFTAIDRHLDAGKLLETMDITAWTTVCRKTRVLLRSGDEKGSLSSGLGVEEVYATFAISNDLVTTERSGFEAELDMLCFCERVVEQARKNKLKLTSNEARQVL